jgi:hypothetical protein
MWTTADSGLRTADYRLRTHSLDASSPVTVASRRFESAVRSRLQSAVGSEAHDHGPVPLDDDDLAVWLVPPADAQGDDGESTECDSDSGAIRQSHRPEP